MNWAPCAVIASDDAGDLVAAQIVEQDDVVRPQLRRQHLLDISAEALAVDGAIKDTRCGDPAAAQTGHQGGDFPMSVRHRRQQPQPARRPAIASRHIGGGPSLVDKDQVVGIERGLATDESAALLGYVGAILLGGSKGSFFERDIAAPSRNRHKLVSPTVISCPAASALRSSCKVRSGCLASNSNTAGTVLDQARAVVAPQEASPPAKAFDIVRLDRFARCRFELYHIVAIADEDAGYGDGRASVCRRGTKLLVATLIMHLPVHRTIQSRSWRRAALI